MNVLQMMKERGRWTMIDENTWGMILGKSGKLPGKVGMDLLELAKEQNRSFYEGNPRDLYPDELQLFASKMDEKGWDYGKDDEELLEYAMHPAQYEKYKSREAKKEFLADLEKRRQRTDTAAAPAEVPMQAPSTCPSELVVNVDGHDFAVKISYPGSSDHKVANGSATKEKMNNSNGKVSSQMIGSLKEITAPLEGKFYLTKDSSEKALKIGDRVNKGDTVAYIESMKVYNAITSSESGTIVDILRKHGDEIEEDDTIFRLQ